MDVAERYGNDRRSEIDPIGGGDIDLEDLIEDEAMIVTITHQGLVKRTPIGEYRQQGRGGRGLRGAGTRDEDYVEHLFSASTHDYLLFFTDAGRCYWLRVYNAPEGSRTAKGRSVRNLIQISQEDRVRAVLAVKKENFRSDEFLNEHFVLMATKRGTVKKTPIEAFSRPRVDGIIAIDVVEGDELLGSPPHRRRHGGGARQLRRPRDPLPRIRRPLDGPQHARRARHGAARRARR